MHPFAWDNISFSVPDDWELASYETNTSRSHVEMDDGNARRLIAEWIRLPPRFNAVRIQERFVRAATKFKKQALASRELSGLPRQWFATLYSMPDGNRVLAASHLAAEQHRFFSFLLYSYKNDPQTRKDNEAGTLKEIAASLQIHAGAVTPWHCFDFSFELSSDFRLAETIFLSGRKQMVFRWRGRSLYVWLISLADLALSGRPVHVWAANFLNGIEGLRGPKFLPTDDGGVTNKRRVLWALGHADQLSRLCFRYKVGFEHHPERNQIFLWAYHYRRADDLKKLDGLKFKPQPFS